MTGVKGKQFIKRLKARGVRITKKRGKGVTYSQSMQGASSADPDARR